MIERAFIAQKTKEYYIKKFIEARLSKTGVSHIKLKKIPLGEKIIIHTSRPSLIVGSKGSNIRDLTKALKAEFKLENPQIEIEEVKNIYLDSKIVAEQIASSLERFGSARFKGIGHKMMENVMNSGALGVEIHISGKIPSARAKSWRFYQGYLKKCGDVAVEHVRKATASALLKTGMIGIQVAIMPPDVKLPDSIEIRDQLVAQPEATSDKKAAEAAAKTSSLEKKKKAASKKKAPSKKTKTAESGTKVAENIPETKAPETVDATETLS